MKFNSLLGSSIGQISRLSSYIRLNAILMASMLVILAVGCSDSGNAKRNTRELFTLEINNSYCGINIKKSFRTQQLLCENISYELSRRSCAQNEYEREYYDNNCHRLTVVPGQPSLGIPTVGAGGVVPFDPNGTGELPQTPVVNIDYTAADQAYIEMMIALDRYYTMDSSNCIARVIRTGDLFDLCYIESLEDNYWNGSNHGPEKDDEDVYRPTGSGERATPPATAPRLSDTAAAGPSPVAPPAEAPVSPPTRPVAAPPAEAATGGNLDYNLVYFNEDSTRYESRTDSRIPFLSITARVDQNSPMNGLTHSNPSEFLNVSIVGQETACPVLRAQISTTPNNILVAVLSVTREANTSQIEGCRNLILSLTTAQTFDLVFETPLVFSGNRTIPDLVRFTNQ